MWSIGTALTDNKIVNSTAAKKKRGLGGNLLSSTILGEEDLVLSCYTYARRDDDCGNSRESCIAFNQLKHTRTGVLVGRQSIDSDFPARFYTLIPTSQLHVLRFTLPNSQTIQMVS